MSYLHDIWCKGVNFRWLFNNRLLVEQMVLEVSQEILGGSVRWSMEVKLIISTTGVEWPKIDF